jgi:hypothetical protein
MSIRLQHIQNLLKEISYKEGWSILTTNRATPDSLQEFILIYWKFDAPDVKTGLIETWTSRKYYISPYMSDSEIIQTAFLAAKVAEEHEILEAFKYKGKTLFSPHMDLNYFINTEIPEDARNHQEQL